MRQTLALAALLVLASACSRDTAPAPGRSVEETFRAQLNADWKYWMEQYPEWATLIGYPGQNNRWTDYSPGAIDARAAYLRKSAEQLSSIDRGGLPSSSHLDFDLYRDLLHTAVDGLQFQNDAIPFRGVIPHNLL